MTALPLEPHTEALTHPPAPVMTEAQWAETVRRQYEVAIRRNRHIPDSWSLAPRAAIAAPVAQAGEGR